MLDGPETLLGVSLAIWKTGMAGTLLGILFRREYRLSKVLSAFAAGIGTSVWIVPALNIHYQVKPEAIAGMLIFVGGVGGIYVFSLGAEYGPQAARALLRRFFPSIAAPAASDGTSGDRT